MSACIDLTGQTFSRLTVLCRAGVDNWGQATWTCLCKCGLKTTVPGGKLRRGHTRSCGCLGVESREQAQLTHGKTSTRIYSIWSGMKFRCENKDTHAYAHYGGRGINVCLEWQRFPPFYIWAMAHGYNKKLTIDRRDNNAGYNPDNCRWATRKEQSQNTRANKTITNRRTGETHCISEWSRRLGGSSTLVYKRLLRGWTPQQAVETPSLRGL